MDPFAPRVALVTGGGSGIGRALALALAGRGARVHVVGRSRERLEAVAAEARGRGGEGIPRVADLARDEDVEGVVAAVLGAGADLDVLVHAAAVIQRAELASVAPADFDEQLAVNLRAPFLLTRALLPALRRARGQVVFVNSSAGRAAAREVGPYCAGKHALRALADVLRLEENARGVRVLSVYPGRTATPTQERLHELEGKPYRPETLLQPEDVAASVLAALALPHTAEVTDLEIRPFVPPGA